MQSNFMFIPMPTMDEKWIWMDVSYSRSGLGHTYRVFVLMRDS